MDENIQDVVIIGAGPSSLAAAIYTTRENINTVLFEKSAIGGMAAITDRIDNYPGFPDGIEGFELTDLFRKQAERFGAKIEFGSVSAIRGDGKFNYVTVDDKEIKAKAVLIATGNGYGKIGVPGEAEYYGKGVHYCATCDGAFYKNKKLAVVGGANSAIQEAMFLARFASHIDIIVRSSIKASEVLKEKLQEFIDKGQISVHLGAMVEEIIGENGKVSSIKLSSDGGESIILTDGVFVFTGHQPNTDFLAGSGIELDAEGYVKTDDDFQTNIAGVFASGDVRSGSIRQVACAVGEGAKVSRSIREYLGLSKKI